MRGWGEELSRDHDCAGERASGRAMIAMIAAVS
jgi:hypothetical protein